jgi:hypothetical protein
MGFITFIDSTVNRTYPYLLYSLDSNRQIYENPKSEDDKFIELNKIKFLDILQKKSLDLSKNINPIFYEKREFIEYMKNQNTELENSWKTRIQMISTPRGNIIMVYDAYKLGFAYYSDQNTLSYDILNSCAMKYVIAYQCADFFIDEYILPDESKNPLKIHYLDTVPDTNTNKINENRIEYKKNTTLKSPFMKPKQNNISTQSQNNKLRNKFIYLGNMRNFSPCQKPKKTVQGFVSVLLDGISSSSISWTDYKNSIKPV